VPEDRLDRLAWILVAGASGLIAGLVWPPIGVAAGIGLVVYFLLAIAAHIRANDAGNLVAPVVMELLAVASLVL
jgi:DoxX-like family